MKFLCPSIFYILDVFRYHLIDFLSDLKQRLGGFGALIKADLLAKNVLDFVYHALAAAECFGKTECTHVLQRLIERKDANRFDGAAVLRWVDRKGISRREHVTCAGIDKRVDGVARKGGIVEVISPMQKSNNVELIKLQSNGAGAPQGHCDKAIGNAHSLRAAIICPKTRDACLDERLDMIGGGDRQLYKSILIKLKV